MHAPTPNSTNSSDRAEARASNEAMLSLATDPERTPFDYIVVGSGAGGGPLACRLALNGRRVLVIEAGCDPASVAVYPGSALAGVPAKPELDREVYQVPGYNAAATEDDAMSWQFSVRHYASDARQHADSKYNASKDPSAHSAPGKGGIFYPRSSGLGGCTDHHAMIIAKPNDEDWSRIATLTGDDSWRPHRMQAYFSRIEDCLYYSVYQSFFEKIIWFYRAWLKLVSYINPRWQLDRGGHGYRGWQKTSFINPMLITKIAWKDWVFLRVLFSAIRFLLLQKGQLRALVGALLKLRTVQFLDPNFGTEREGLGSRISFIPIGTDGRRRTGLREHLLAVAESHPENLVLLTGVLVERVIFESPVIDATPRAVGVAVLEGLHLYRASPLSNRAANSPPRRQYFAKQEIILAAGSFNTPQILMLSGIGNHSQLVDLGVPGLRDRNDRALGCWVDLPGVGKNLQDRYEVSVVSEAERDFSTLKDASFAPEDAKDPARQLWLKTGGGLYATNGGALAFFRRTSQAKSVNPDLFIFGVPAAFRGYYWKWSKELLRQTMGAPEESRNLWTWVLLKAYTKNNGGELKLRSTSPLEPPEIVFHSFSEGPQGYESDVTALAEGVQFVREMNSHIGALRNEIQPGTSRPDGSSQLREWMQDEAWGHHACGTCRIGSDRWRSQVSTLSDRDAVLDSKFRVHGVRGLRVVDASVFPSIPGYFIVTPIFMVSEKAADDLLADSQVYPPRLEAFEAAAIEKRRQIAGGGQRSAAAPVPSLAGSLASDTVGLALSGGGVRSATICLGVLQALAQKNRLSKIDILSTVSGGGYIGAFLGRLYTRIQAGVADPATRVTEVLSRADSDEIWWLRSHAKYLTGEGLPDLKEDFGTVWRNVFAIHLCVGALAVCVFSFLHFISHGSDFWAAVASFPGPFFGSSRGWSPWWWVPIAIVVLALVPSSLAYFLAPTPGSSAPFPPLALLTWIVLLMGAVAAIAMTGAFILPIAGIAILMLTWIWQETVQWGLPENAELCDRGVIARNRLTRAVGSSAGLAIGATLWVLVDSLALWLGDFRHPLSVVGGMTAFSMSVPLLRSWLTKYTGGSKLSAFSGALPSKVKLAIASVSLFTLLVIGLDAIAHAAFDISSATGLWTLCFSFLTSVVIGRAIGFVNLSSLQNLYAGRLSRTYLGASNSQRVEPPPKTAPKDINVADPDDDLFLHEYHPEERGGPLHLINVCVNQNVNVLSGRRQTDDHALAMCVGPEGVSVGVRYHAIWDARYTAPMQMTDIAAGMFQTLTASGAPLAPVANEMTALRAIPVNADPDAFHVLADLNQDTVAVEPLRLSQWTGISGAAFSTGEGRLTSLPLCLLFGILNLRLGYWWNSGIDEGDRPGQFPPSFLSRLKSLPGRVFRTQRTILNEWRGYFGGPSKRLWYLSDGGHFENTGLYELIRRRVPLMFAVDAEEDAGYHFNAMGLLVRQTRLDFGAEFNWIDPTDARRSGAKSWTAVDIATGAAAVPAWIRAWLNPDAVGPLGSIARSGPFAASLARICYDDDSATVSWLVIVKACLAITDMPLDLRCYSVANATFPNESTIDQFPNEDEWESWRLVGEAIGRGIFA